MESDTSAIIAQPQAVEIDSLVIKPMEKADCEFAGAMLVDAFLPKVEHAVGKDKVDTLTSGFVQELSTRPAGGYDDMYIAWYAGERAGFIMLEFHDTKRPKGDQSFQGLRICCGGIRLGIMEAVFAQSIDKNTCYLDTIAVDARFRGKGIGRGLLQKADQEAMQRGCNNIYLIVVEGNPAIQLYERQGYNIALTKYSCCLNFSAGYSRFHKMIKQLV